MPATRYDKRRTCTRCGTSSNYTNPWTLLCRFCVALLKSRREQQEKERSKCAS